MRTIVLSIGVSSVVGLAALAGCESKDPAPSSFYERSIAPVLTTSCVRTNTGAGCHVADARGNALGNLDLSSFSGTAKRRDLMLDYGPYGQPAFLLKNIPPVQISIQSFDGQATSITTDIKHSGGPILDPTASAYQALRRWIENGATENNTGRPAANVARAVCNRELPKVQGFDAGNDSSRADFGEFRDKVNPVLAKTCAAGNCHGTAANELYLTCGDSPEQVRWNYFAAREYLANVPEQSELIRRPLEPSQGGSYHEGGAIFPSTEDTSYRAIADWARSHGPPEFGSIEPNFAFFAHRVQPVLVKKGCTMVQCHSAAMFHDYRLRGGTAGSFSFSATRRNYALSLAQLSLESSDINASRLVRKNLFRSDVYDGSNGLAHRGGALLEDFGNQLATGERCDEGTFDYDGGDLNAIPAYCVIREWLKRERTARNLAPLSGIVYVKRPLSDAADRPQDFDVYAPGADLRMADASFDQAGALQVGASRSLTAGCGLNVSSADIRRPSVSWDGKKVAFAARSSASEPLQVYEMNADGSSCSKHAPINNVAPSGNGLLIHNFDPVYSPPDDAGRSYLVFASTRGNMVSDGFDYSGPQRTPADVTKPNANLYVFEPDPGTRIRQLTFQLNLEREPNFMSDGRLIFSAEKRAPNFYQLALRRMNLDSGDYHPLIAQRGSVGFTQARGVIELADKNFAAIMSDQGAAHGAGALVILNRSIGIDFTSDNPRDYPVDPTVRDPASLSSIDNRFFLHSLRSIDPAATGKLATNGAYYAPSPLPEGDILVSYAATTDGGAARMDFDLYVVDEATGARTKLLGDPGFAEVDAVGIYARAGRGIFNGNLEEPNGVTRVEDNGAGASEVLVLDSAVLGSLLFQNTPTGRVVESDLKAFELYEDMPPPLEASSFGAAGEFASQDEFGPYFVKRRRLGQVSVAADGSAKFRVVGGMPIVIKLDATEQSRKLNLPRFQREAMTFSPGEHAHQSFRREFFDSMCGFCHGTVSGHPIDGAVRPDMLTQASAVVARDQAPIDLAGSPGSRGAPIGPAQSQ